MTNLQGHGIDFADVWQIFYYDRVSDVDDRFDYGEVRFVTFGLLRGDVIVVAPTETDDAFRIISARKAEKYEQEIYLDKIRH